MNELKQTDNRHPHAVKLREKFNELRAAGLQDIKFWYVGDTGFNGSDGPTVDDLSCEVLSIIDAYERKAFVDISAKLK